MRYECLEDYPDGSGHPDQMPRLRPQCFIAPQRIYEKNEESHTGSGIAERINFSKTDPAYCSSHIPTNTWKCGDFIVMKNGK